MHRGRHIIGYALSSDYLIIIAAADSGQLIQKINNLPLRIQFKMDACRSWAKVQQTSLDYVFVRACANPGSPYDTTELCLFEGDDHWDAVAVHAAGAIAEIK